MKKLAGILLIFLFIVFSATACFYLDLIMSMNHPANPDQALTANMVIHPGQQFRSISTDLHRMGVIKYPFKFRVFARINNLDKRIRAGEYVLSSTMTPREIFQILVAGRVRLYKVTVPEGYSQYQIAGVVADTGLADAEAFLRFVRDPGQVHAFEIEADSFEGYLFPDTYYFSKGISIDRIVTTMVNRFRSQFRPAWKERAEKIGLSIHEVVTLASIIEKETGAPFERSVISSVFHNRLRKKMRLESDPTVIYGIKAFDGNITRKHLKAQTPYNTYRIRGLPPGPIANPGSAAIESALYPEETPYLFFVSKKNGTHQFSKSISDHNRAVRKYQLRKR